MLILSYQARLNPIIIALLVHLHTNNLSTVSTKYLIHFNPPLLYYFILCRQLSKKRVMGIPVVVSGGESKISSSTIPMF
jgi:hypothetical protein